MSAEELVVENANGKQRVVKVIVKEVQKTTVACDACRTQHTKCDGKFPCSYCVAKNRQCEYSEPKKRGPKRRLVAKESGDQYVQKTEQQQQSTTTEENSLISLVAATTEREMLDNIEANKYFDFYLKFMSYLSVEESNELVRPKTTSKKVQAYATLAASSRILGDSVMSQKYISQARMLGGLIYDSPDPDGSAAMLIMHKYFQLVLDLPRATHYATMAASISKMTPPAKKDVKMDLMCKISSVLINEKLTNQQQARKIKDVSRKCTEHVVCLGTLSSYLDFAALFLEIVGYHVFFTSSFTLENTFEVLDNAHINAEDREKILRSLNKLMVDSMGYDRPGFVLFLSVFGPMFMAITEWKSGNITEALSHTMTTMNALQHLQNENTIGLVAGLPQVCTLGSLAKFLHSRGLNNLARQMCQYIYQICDLMTPVFDFVRALLDRFVQISLNDEAPTATATAGMSPPPPTNLFTPPVFVHDNVEYRPQNDSEQPEAGTHPAPPDLLNFSPFSLIYFESGTPDTIHRFTGAMNATSVITPTTTTTTFPQDFMQQNPVDFVQYIETTNTSYFQPLRFDANGEVIE